MRILYARDRVTSPWKNGGGTTSEVAVFPPGAGLDDFGWRISIAKVERGGPFSVFPRIDRTIALFEGRMSLAIGGQDAVELSPDAPPLAFPGDVATGATLIEGPVIDLNVMTRRGAFTAHMTRHRSGAFDFGGATTFVFPLAPVTLRDEMTSLVPGDALFAGPDVSRHVSFSSTIDLVRIEIFPAGKAL